jgi:SOS-response transcriptional repressor LexA
MRAGVTLTAADWRRFAALLAALRAGRGVCPSYRELATLWGFTSTSPVASNLERLEVAGLIYRQRARWRAIGITRHLVPVATRHGDVLLPMREARP